MKGSYDCPRSTFNCDPREDWRRRHFPLADETLGALSASGTQHSELTCHEKCQEIASHKSWGAAGCLLPRVMTYFSPTCSPLSVEKQEGDACADTVALQPRLPRWRQRAEQVAALVQIRGMVQSRLRLRELVGCWRLCRGLLPLGRRNSST